MPDRHKNLSVNHTPRPHQWFSVHCPGIIIIIIIIIILPSVHIIPREFKN